MSTLEKAINLLQTMPENKIESIYMYLCLVSAQTDETDIEKKKDALSIVGIANKYANPKLRFLEKEAFANAMAEKHALD